MSHYFMIADEADQNLDKSYFVSAGVFIPTRNNLEIHERISEIRKRYGFRPEDDLKSSSGSKPVGVDREAHTEAKNAVLDLAAEYKCKACCYIVPSKVAKGQELKTRHEWSVNTLLGKFDSFLCQKDNRSGTAYFDHTTDFKQADHLKSSFAGLIDGKYGKIKYKKITGVGTTQNGMSHLNSLTDIVIGSFRFVVNEQDKDKVGRILLTKLAKIMWHTRTSDGTISYRDFGFVVRPVTLWEQNSLADLNLLTKNLQCYLEGS